MPVKDPRIARTLGAVRRVLAGVPLRGARLLVAWSGGPDSGALLGLLDLIAPQLELSLCIGHVDHGIRPESAREADLVVRFARSRGLDVEVTRLDLPRGAGLAARARAQRRSALQDQARTFGAGIIALGHTATDQTETIVMHLVRGAGLDGMAGMPEQDTIGGITWLRPLLAVERDRTRTIAELLEVPFVDDPTNEDLTSWRVKIRTTVLPILRDRNPRLEQAVCGAARQARDADEALVRWTEREIAGRRERPHPEDEAEHGPIAGYYTTRDIDRLPRAVRTRFVRRVCIDEGADAQSLGHDLVEAVDAALVGRGGAEASAQAMVLRDTKFWDLRPGLRLCVSRYGMWARPGGGGGE